MRKRAGMVAYFLVSAEVAETVEDVVHPHDGGGRLGGEQSLRDRGCRDGFRQHGFRERAALRAAMRRSYGRAPGLLLGKFRLPQDAAQVEFQVFGILRDTIPEVFEFNRLPIDSCGARHGGTDGLRRPPHLPVPRCDGRPHLDAGLRTASPFCQLQGQSSSVCSASSTRRTSCGLRPTERSLTETKRMTPAGSTMKVARCATPSLRIQNAQRRAQLALDVGQHGEGQILQIGMVLPPGQMHELGIRAAAENLRVAILELAG